MKRWRPGGGSNQKNRWRRCAANSIGLRCSVWKNSRERYYETVNGPVRDIPRYLADEPVEARPPAAGYRLVEFLDLLHRRDLSRHRTLAIVAKRRCQTRNLWVKENRHEAVDGVRIEWGEKMNTRMRNVARTIALGVLLAIIGPAVADVPKLPLLTPEEQKLADEAATLNGEAVQSYRQGRPAAAIAKVRQAVEILRKVYPAAKYPDGHPDLADSLNGLGVLLQAMGRAEQALPYYRQSLEMRQKLYPAAKYPDGHPYLAISLNGLGFVLEAMGQPEQALPFCRQALEMRQRLFPAEKYPNGHPDLAVSLNDVGLVLRAMGQAEQALPFYRQSLEMHQKLLPAAKYPDGHPDLARSLSNVGGTLAEMGQAEQALAFLRQSLEMYRKLFPAGHPELARGLHNMGFVLQAMGQPEQAFPYYRQGLDMRQKLFPTAKYPDGHPDLAHSLDGLGVVLQAMGQAEQALPYYRQSLEMRQKLYPAAKYPDGHPDLAMSLNDVGFVLQAMGQAEQALPFYRQSLEMYQKLFAAAKYPDGHPNIARSLNNLGGMLAEMGRPEQALPFARQSLEMTQKLYPAAKYPDGHPYLSHCLSILGVVLEGMGQLEQASPFYRQSLEMRQKLFPVAKYPDGHPYLADSLGRMGRMLLALSQPEPALGYLQRSLQMQQRLLRRELATASEEAAFDKITAAPLFRDAYLGITRTVKTSPEADYADLWPSRSMVTRLLEQRQANARAAGTETGAKLDRLRGLRRRLDQLLQDTRMNSSERDRLLVTVANERDQLERELVAKIPTLKHWQELDQLGPADLVKALPADSVFIDLIRYTRFEYGDKKWKRTLNYVAFVLAKPPLVDAAGSPLVLRVELEEAGPIDAAVRQWRTAIELRRDDPEAVAELTRRVWEPLAKSLLPGTKTLYIAPDGDLARLPWAALPSAKDRVLLEDFAIAQVPHGMFLLDHLKFPRTFAGPESLLTLGGVDYGPGDWPALAGTALEVQAIAALAPGQLEALSKTDATAARLTERLPQARFAHLATHGEFQAEALTAERKRDVEALAARQFGDDARKVAAKNPLGYVGLVLANGEIMSGLSILDLRLENLQLVTLSACETGLGDLAGGEGVQGLQRAFHLAGCPNVVASLWKVNDAATAALMAKFYHELWTNKKPARGVAGSTTDYLPASRTDPHLAGERGAPKLRAAIVVKTGEPGVPATGVKRADTRLWAAFVLSGVGR